MTSRRTTTDPKYGKLWNPDMDLENESGIIWINPLDPAVQATFVMWEEDAYLEDPTVIRAWSNMNEHDIHEFKSLDPNYNPLEIHPKGWRTNVQWYPIQVYPRGDDGYYWIRLGRNTFYAMIEHKKNASLLEVRVNNNPELSGEARSRASGVSALYAPDGQPAFRSMPHAKIKDLILPHPENREPSSSHLRTLREKFAQHARDVALKDNPDFEGDAGFLYDMSKPIPVGPPDELGRYQAYGGQHRTITADRVGTSLTFVVSGDLCRVDVNDSTKKGTSRDTVVRLVKEYKKGNRSPEAWAAVEVVRLAKRLRNLENGKPGGSRSLGPICWASHWLSGNWTYSSRTTNETLLYGEFRVGRWTCDDQSPCPHTETPEGTVEACHKLVSLLEKFASEVHASFRDKLVFNWLADRFQKEDFSFEEYAVSLDKLASRLKATNAKRIKTDKKTLEAALSYTWENVQRDPMRGKVDPLFSPEETHTGPRRTTQSPRTVEVVENVISREDGTLSCVSPYNTSIVVNNYNTPTIPGWENN